METGREGPGMKNEVKPVYEVGLVTPSNSEAVIKSESNAAHHIHFCAMIVDNGSIFEMLTRRLSIFRNSIIVVF